eukprot:gene3060-3342_t
MKKGQQERPGSKGSLKLLSSDLLDSWVWYSEHYDSALARVTEEKKKQDQQLKEWDNFLFSQLPALVRARSPRPYLTHTELAQVMKWKLSRGKFRPLQKMVESNSSQVVQESSMLAMEALDQGLWEDAFTHLMKLRGVGVATASAFLAAMAPALCPFMADEVIECTVGKRDYTMAVYKLMRKVLLEKAEALGEGWTAERVGKALWTAAVLTYPPPPPATTTPSDSKDGVDDNNVKEKITGSSSVVDADGGSNSGEASKEQLLQVTIGRKRRSCRL